MDSENTWSTCRPRRSRLISWYVPALFDFATTRTHLILTVLQVSLVGATTTYNLAVMCTKSSILLYYLRFPASRAFRLVTYGVLIISVGYTLSGMLAFAYNCNPIEKAWDKSMTTGTCIQVTKSLIVRAVFNVFTDLCILLLPIWLLWPLRLWSIWQRLSVMVVLMAGGLCVFPIRPAMLSDFVLTGVGQCFDSEQSETCCVLDRLWAYRAGPYLALCQELELVVSSPFLCFHLRLDI